MPASDYLPTFDHRETHERAVDADAQSCYRAVKELTVGELPRTVRILFALRTLPARLAGAGGARAATGPVLEHLARRGFVVLDDVPGREIVLGTAGQFWKLSGGTDCRGLDRGTFRALDGAGLVKAAIDFRVRPSRGGASCVVSTETRVLATDSEARRKFRAYWFVVRPGSALIRRLWLGAVKRRAERGAPSPS